MEYSVREARITDLDVLVSFTLAEAREAEGAVKNTETVRRGVRAGLRQAGLVTYWVAEAATGEPVGSSSAVKEWSDWHAANYWWIQSMYILPEHRGRGLLELLFETIVRAAREDGSPQLRLYVHRENQRAIRAYRRCEFEDLPYQVMALKLG